MEIMIYALIFITGLMFGSFFSLATYRIPLGKDITHERSFCPKCDHKLGFWDMIPVLSYLFLKGKCRYCSAKIGVRYILLELITGGIFVLFAMSLNIHFSQLQEMDVNKIIYLMIGFLYISGLMLIGMIDKEKRMVSKPVLIYGMVILFGYILYLYILEKANMYRYAIYLIMMCLLIIANTIFLRKKTKENYTIDILLLCIYIALFSGQDVFIYTIFLTLGAVLMKSFFGKANKNMMLSIGFYLCNANIIMLIIENFIKYRS